MEQAIKDPILNRGFSPNKNDEPINGLTRKGILEAIRESGKRGISVTKGQSKKKKVCFSIKLMEIIFIVISKGIAVFFHQRRQGDESEQKSERGGGVSAPFVKHPLGIEVSF